MDHILVCRFCGQGFIFSAGEQELQRLRGFARAPTHCSICLLRTPMVPQMPACSLAAA